MGIFKIVESGRKVESIVQYCIDKSAVLYRDPSKKRDWKQEWNRMTREKFKALPLPLLREPTIEGTERSKLPFNLHFCSIFCWLPPCAFSLEEYCAMLCNFFLFLQLTASLGMPLSTPSFTASHTFCPLPFSLGFLPPVSPSTLKGTPDHNTTNKPKRMVD